MENIQTMYATSVGSIVAIMLLLDYDWEANFDATKEYVKKITQKVLYNGQKRQIFHRFLLTRSNKSKKNKLFNG